MEFSSHRDFITPNVSAADLNLSTRCHLAKQPLFHNHDYFICVFFYICLQHLLNVHVLVGVAYHMVQCCQLSHETN